MDCSGWDDTVATQGTEDAKTPGAFVCLGIPGVSIHPLAEDARSHAGHAIPETRREFLRIEHIQKSCSRGRRPRRPVSRGCHAFRSQRPRLRFYLNAIGACWQAISPCERLIPCEQAPTSRSSWRARCPHRTIPRAQGARRPDSKKKAHRNPVRLEQGNVCGDAYRTGLVGLTGGKSTVVWGVLMVGDD